MMEFNLTTEKIRVIRVGTSASSAFKIKIKVHLSIFRLKQRSQLHAPCMDGWYPRRCTTIILQA
jgi:hypothetical protein